MKLYSDDENYDDDPVDAILLHLKGMSWNIHKNNERADRSRHILEEINGKLSELINILNK